MTNSFLLKIFVPLAFLARTILVPVNWTNSTVELAKLECVTSSNTDKLSISNVPLGSVTYGTFAHLVQLSFPCLVIANLSLCFSG